MAEFTDQNAPSRAPDNAGETEQATSPETEEKLVSEIQKALQAATRSSFTTNDQYRQAGRRLSKLRAMGYKGKVKVEALCKHIGYDLTYEEVTQFIAIAESKELNKYWDRLICRGPSPLYAFTILTKHPKAYAKFQKEVFKGPGPYDVSKSLIESYIPTRNQGKLSSKAANTDTQSTKLTVGCDLKLLEEDADQETEFVKRVRAITDQFACELTPTPRFEEIGKQLDAKASNLE